MQKSRDATQPSLPLSPFLYVPESRRNQLTFLFLPSLTEEKEKSRRREREMEVNREEEEKVPLLEESTDKEGNGAGLGCRILIESKKLWQIVGPAIVSRLSLYAMNIITQAFAGHLGNLELAAFSIANTVVIGFVFGLLVCYSAALFLFLAIVELSSSSWRVFFILK